MRIDRGVKCAAMLLSLTLIVLQGVSVAQQRNVGQLPEFDADAFCFRGEQGESIVTVYVRVKHSKLSFTKQNGVFMASYEVVVDFLDEKEKMVKEKTWQDTVITKNYAESMSRDVSRTTSFSLELPPGAYIANVQLRDKESERVYTQRRRILVKDFKQGKATISSLMIVDAQFDEQGAVQYMPNLTASVKFGKENPQIYYEVYRNDPSVDSLNVRYSLFSRGRKEEEVLTYRRTVFLGGKKTRVLDTLNTTALNTGDYALVVALENNTDPSMFDKSAILVLVRAQGIASLIRDMKKAIEQLEYIADGDELAKMRDAKTPEEQAKLFNAFWKKYDPTPGTPENELMTEYYTRVEYANQNFGSYMEGWRSDMGRIYIKYGQPDFIERQPFSMNQRPYEIWEFYQHNLRLTFVDVSGLGNYRLLRPEWDSRNRIR
jgi:GWxTD domain-containing protein